MPGRDGGTRDGAAEERRDVLHHPLGEPGSCSGRQDLNQGIPARDLFEAGRAHRLADLYESPWRLDAVGDSGRCAKGRRVRVQQLEIGVLP